MNPRILVNAMTIDVEDYFQVSALAPYIAREDWPRRECRVERNVERILELLARHDATATFFTLGWIAERHPRVVHAIVAQGHELASHGYAHRRVGELGPAGFRDDVVTAKALLEDIGGVEVHGYRAPSFSIDGSTPWAFDVLAEAGYRYSSSVYPIRHDHYGMPEAPRFAWRTTSGVLEIPATTLRVGGQNLPSSGGGYFRLMPYAMSRWMIRRVNAHDGQSAVFYFHPWELDPAQPRVPGIDAKTRFRHYLNLSRMESRLDTLLSDFRWDRMDRVFRGAGAVDTAAPALAAA
jgi:polysaccharide deacetylase family protein (PEP-CTERM system associated)